MAPGNVHRPLPQRWSSPSPQTVANYNGTLQWHHVRSPKSWSSHPLNPPPTSTPSKLALNLPCPHPATPQWYPAMAPRPKVGLHPPLPQSWSSPSPQTIANYNGTLLWHLTLPPNHSTLQWHPAMAPRPLLQSWPSPSPPP